MTALKTRHCIREISGTLLLQYTYSNWIYSYNGSTEDKTLYQRNIWHPFSYSILTATGSTATMTALKTRHCIREISGTLLLEYTYSNWIYSYNDSTEDKTLYQRNIWHPFSYSILTATGSTATMTVLKTRHCIREVSGIPSPRVYLQQLDLQLQWQH